MPDYAARKSAVELSEAVQENLNAILDEAAGLFDDKEDANLKMQTTQAMAINAIAVALVYLADVLETKSE